MTSELVNALAPTILKSGIGLVVTGVLMYPFKRLYKEAVALKDNVNATHSELVKQRTNCLSTIQENGKQQIALLAKVVDVLGDIRTDNKLTLEHLRDRSA